ncbi:hypothetical protein QC763_407255 [Podospora pseudopauciseta]|uniref:Uncharacterized protein n=1 Tax=Podospora pseudopauciseta TaxID=2093780 RepID=A0ABR0HDA6_9PEZI|nr:hypothetical protein QC763_407255 [Podospora pseudopauciseta]
MGVLFLRGRYKRRVKALGKDRGGSSSGGSSTTIGNDVGVVEVENKEMVIAELDGTPVAKRAEMDVEGGYKELDVEFGYGELDVMEKRLSEKGERYGVDKEEIKQSSNKERAEREDEENADDAGGMVGKEERMDQNGGQTTKSKRTSADIAQMEEITYQTIHER